ncbi:MAG: N-acetylmuramoyl-L-alanine amidase [Candidatus Omnitrophota bacterium]
MLNTIFKKFKFWAVALLPVFYFLTIFGCATVPAKMALPSYNINGMAYFPLFSYAELKNIDWKYDTFTRVVSLSKGSHRISMRVGDNLVLIDGVPRYISNPADIYQGTVVAPYKFKEQVLDSLFKEVYPTGRPALSSLKIRRVVVDAGHGGNDPGAIGRTTGLREKDVNLDIAKRLSNLLRGEGVEVVMTRASDRFIPLPRRVEITNDSGADFFLSLHSNANRVRSLSGFEVYYVSPSVSDSKRAFASAGNAPLNLNNACFDSQSLNLKAILWDMIYTSGRAESIELAQSICRAASSNLNARVLGVKGARYEVLRNARIPAVLVEVGFLSNYNEERMLKNSYYRQRIAESIMEGIRDYADDLVIVEAANK